MLRFAEEVYFISFSLSRSLCSQAVVYSFFSNSYKKDVDVTGWLHTAIPLNTVAPDIHPLLVELHATKTSATRDRSKILYYAD